MTTVAPYTKISLIIAGSRTVDPSDEEIDRAVLEIVILAFNIEDSDPDVVERTRANLHEYVGEVVCGKADGGDAAGARWARARGIPVFEDPVTEEDRRRWGPYLAPKMRNRRMAERGTHAVCFWDGTSGGTADMHTRMGARRKPSLVFPTRKRPARRRGQRAAAS